VNALQHIVSRNIDPLESAVISIPLFQAGHTDNVIPQTAHLRGTARSFSPQVRDQLEKRIAEVVEHTAKAHGAKATVTYKRDYPVVVNTPKEAEFASKVASEIVSESHVKTAVPVMGAEDFAFMLEKRPGAFIFMGNGNSANLHHPAYDFHDKAIPFGTSYWVRLVENAMPA
jgi:hippurate hydrolase